MIRNRRVEERFDRAAAAGTPLVAGLVLLASLTAEASPLAAQVSHWERVLCKPGLTLAAAKGVPDQARRGYVFKGTCIVQNMKTNDWGTAVTAEHVFPVALEAAWDEASHQLEEVLEIAETTSWSTGSGFETVSGEAKTTYTCTSDPVVTNAKCSGKQHDNASTLYSLSAAFEKNVPWSAELTSLTEAAAMSKQAASTSPPPPPPAKPKPKIALKSGSGAARVVVREPTAGARLASDPVIVEAMLFDDHARKYRVDGIRFDWQVKNEAGGRAALREPWLDQRVLGKQSWTGSDGRYFVARASVPRERLAAGVHWRVRALSSAPDVEGTDWIEFDLVDPIRTSTQSPAQRGP